MDVLLIRCLFDPEYTPVFVNIVIKIVADYQLRFPLFPECSLRALSFAEAMLLREQSGSLASFSTRGIGRHGAA